MTINGGDFFFQQFKTQQHMLFIISGRVTKTSKMFQISFGSIFLTTRFNPRYEQTHVHMYVETLWFLFTVLVYELVGFGAAKCDGNLIKRLTASFV